MIDAAWWTIGTTLALGTIVSALFLIDWSLL